jgi:hypothetical protein
MVLRGVRHESEVLLRQVDGRITTLRAGRAHGLESAEDVAGRLRSLVADTAHSSAADRARVRAAVHYFVGMRNSRDRRHMRSLAEDLRVIDTMVAGLADVSWTAA